MIYELEDMTGIHDSLSISWFYNHHSKITIHNYTAIG